MVAVGIGFGLGALAAFALSLLRGPEADRLNRLSAADPRRWPRGRIARATCATDGIEPGAMAGPGASHPDR